MAESQVDDELKNQTPRHICHVAIVLTKNQASDMVALDKVIKQHTA